MLELVGECQAGEASTCTDDLYFSRGEGRFFIYWNPVRGPFAVCDSARGAGVIGHAEDGWKLTAR